jgi:hypothetical protein
VWLGTPNRVQAYGAVGQSLHNDFSGLSGVPRLTNVATSSILKYYRLIDTAAYAFTCRIAFGIKYIAHNHLLGSKICANIVE